MTQAENFRRYVLNHWSRGGWCIVVDRLRSKKAAAAIETLVQRGDLLEDNRMYRITDSGLAKIAEWDQENGR